MILFSRYEKKKKNTWILVGILWKKSVSNKLIIVWFKLILSVYISMLVFFFFFFFVVVFLFFFCFLLLLLLLLFFCCCFCFVFYLCWGGGVEQTLRIFLELKSPEIYNPNPLKFITQSPCAKNSWFIFQRSWSTVFYSFKMENSRSEIRKEIWKEKLPPG